MVSLQTIERLGTILSIWAHPDDETFSCAGIMSMAIKNGQDVICVTATKGEAGSQDQIKWPADKLGQIRANELKNALNELGITKHHWLGYHDGKCDIVSDDEAVQKIVKYIEMYRPDTILTFGPDGMTGHPDHKSVSRWVSLATSKVKNPPTVLHAVHTRQQYDNYLKELDEKLNIFFNIDKPRIVSPEDCALCCELSAEVCKLKCSALAKMPSQTETMFKIIDKELMIKALGTEAFIESK